MAGGLGLALAAVWLPVWWRLHFLWMADGEMHHGWAVPVLVGWLAWERARDRPVAEEPGRGLRRWATAAGAAGLGALAVAAPVFEGNPGWPAAAWVETGGALAVTLGLLAAAGGWSWLRAYGPVAALLLTAVPWPVTVLGPVTDGLSVANAALAAEIVSWCGHPAVATGHVIELSRGFVGVEDACSGVRSLQTVTMVALFLGEVERWRARRRAGFWLGAAGLAALANAARATFLTWQVAVHGEAALERWHDDAAGVALVVTLGVLLGWWWCWSGVKPAEKGSERSGGGSLGWIWVGSVVAVVVGIEGATQAWYAWREATAGPDGAWRWSVRAGESWADVAMSRRTRELLGYTSAEAKMRTAGDRIWRAYVIRWEGDATTRAVSAAHDPLICLPASGVRLEKDLGRVTLEVDGRRVDFAAWRFGAAGRSLNVFFSVWDERQGKSVEAATGLGGDVVGYRLRQVWAGRRRAETEQIILAVEAPEDDEAALDDLKTAAPGWLARGR